MKIYFDTHQSLLKFCTDFTKQFNYKSFETFDFDSHGSINNLPDKDLIGVGEFSIDNDVDDYTCTCYIAVATRSDDANLVRLRPVVANLFDMLAPGAQFSVVDANSGRIRGTLTVMGGVSVLPISRTETRPMQLVAVRFAVTLQNSP